MNLLSKIKVGGLTETTGQDHSLKPLQQDLPYQLLDAISTPVIYIDKDQKYCYANKAYASWFDVNARDIVGKSAEEFLGKINYEQIRHYINQALQGNQVHFEDKILYNHQHRLVEIDYMPHQNETGDVDGFIGIFNDTSERKIAEEESAKLAAIVQSSDDAIIVKTLNGIITSWNEAAERIFGFSANEMIGASITKIIPPDRLNEEPKIIQRMLKGERIDHFETERMTKDGGKINVSLTISPVKNNSGKIIGVSKIARDVTKQKKNDEVTARLAAIIDSSDDAIIGKTLDGIITSWNNAAERLFGYKEEEMIGQSIKKLIPLDHKNGPGWKITRHFFNHISDQRFE